jgi:hypothetical protein
MVPNDSLQTSGGVPPKTVDAQAASVADARRRMAYVRERLKEIRKERELLMTERDSLQKILGIPGPAAKSSVLSGKQGI